MSWFFVFIICAHCHTHVSRLTDGSDEWQVTSQKIKNKVFLIYFLFYLFLLILLSVVDFSQQQCHFLAQQQVMWLFYDSISSEFFILDLIFHYLYVFTFVAIKVLRFQWTLTYKFTFHRNGKTFKRRNQKRRRNSFVYSWHQHSAFGFRAG